MDIKASEASDYLRRPYVLSEPSYSQYPPHQALCLPTMAHNLLDRRRNHPLLREQNTIRSPRATPSGSVLHKSYCFPQPCLRAHATFQLLQRQRPPSSPWVLLADIVCTALHNNPNAARAGELPISLVADSS